MIVRTKSGERRVYISWTPLQRQIELMVPRAPADLDAPNFSSIGHTAVSMATLFNVHPRRIKEWMTVDRLLLDRAEACCIAALNVHPMFVWGDEWFEATNEAVSIAEDRRIANNRRSERNAARRRANAAANRSTSLGL